MIFLRSSGPPFHFIKGAYISSLLYVVYGEISMGWGGEQQSPSMGNMSISWGQPTCPKLGIFTTPREEASVARRQGTEHNIVPVLPETPTTK